MNNGLPKTRAEAKAANAKKYYTGVPCRNGHVAARYTMSGTCQDCISHGSDANPSTRAIFKQMNTNQREILDQLIAIPLRSQPGKIEALRKLAGTMLHCRFPELPPERAYSSRPGTHGSGGTLLYQFYAHGDDVQFLQDVAGRALVDHTVNIQAARARIYGTVREDDEQDNEPQFKP